MMRDRHTVATKLIGLRVPPAAFNAINVRAHDLGFNVSEYLRSLIEADGVTLTTPDGTN